MMKNKQILYWMIKHSQIYSHQNIKNGIKRTFENMPQLSTQNCLQICLDVFVKLILQHLKNNKNVAVSQFGLFYIDWEGVNVSKVHFHAMGDFQDRLYYNPKSKINNPTNLVYIQPQNIANQAFIDKNIAKEFLSNFIKAISDLTQLNKNLCLNFKIMQIEVKNRKLSVNPKQSYIKKYFQEKKDIAREPSINLWKSHHQKLWNKSILDGVRERTHLSQIQNLFNRALELKIEYQKTYSRI